jgi:hypothetical protein
MKSHLVRLYPASWRARYGEEFAAILDERPLGPFDVVDILLGALDAQLRLRSMRSDVQHGKRFSMSLRIGGFSAILGGALLAISIVLGMGLVADVEPVVPGSMLIIGSAALLVALAGLSAFQARAHPVLSWGAFTVTAVGMLVSVVGIVGLQIVGEGFWMLFIIGLFGALAGSTIFAITTYVTATLSRGAAALLGAGSLLSIFAGLGGNTFGPIPLVVTAIAFAIGWFALGIHAIRIDQPVMEARPA